MTLGDKVAIACDHRGFATKQAIVNAFSTYGGVDADLPDGVGIDSFVDCGCNPDDTSCDYPDYAAAACKMIRSGEAASGILICGSGNGMAMTANRFPGIRAAVCTSLSSAEHSRAHNNANVLCLSGDLPWIENKHIVCIWLAQEFEAGRHEIRVRKIDELTYD